MKAILTLIVTVAFVLSPLLSGPFSGFRPDQLPIAQINPPVEPEGYAFAIWGLIYVWLLVSACYGLAKRRDDPAWDRVRPGLILSIAVGATWIPIAQTDAVAATFLIFVMLIAALVALYRCPKTDRAWLQIPVALYAGWLTAAACVSLGTIGAGYGLFFGQTGWAVIGIFIALNIGLLVLTTRVQAPEYAIALVWALIGIVVANQFMNPVVSILSVLGIMLVSIKAIGNLRTES
ncbi:hypothetical protein [Algirhabdus cladophorae]|uniref:hypothetical protein n=1 Tax=Algirhabdus cladophorae TaxID=3377108 RepID=UPI003B84655F